MNTSPSDSGGTPPVNNPPSAELRARLLRSKLSMANDAFNRVLDALGVQDAGQIRWTYVREQLSHAAAALRHGRSVAEDGFIVTCDEDGDPSHRPETPDHDPFLPLPHGGPYERRRS